MSAQHHMQGNEKEECAEYLTQDMSLNLRSDDGSDRRTKEEPEREQARDSKVDVTCAVVPKSGEKPDGGK